jgi:hypothetical protein
MYSRCDLLLFGVKFIKGVGMNVLFKIKIVTLLLFTLSCLSQANEMNVFCYSDSKGLWEWVMTDSETYHLMLKK